MEIREEIINQYPLNQKVECEFDCYLLDKRKYLIFWNELIDKSSIDKILHQLETATNNQNFTEVKTLIVFGKTNDMFRKDELTYYNEVGIFVVFYLINQKDNTIFMNDSWIFALVFSYKKYVRKINQIVLNKKLLI